MSQKTEIVAAFERHGWTMTLGQLLEEGRFSFAHKLTARFSDLRREGYQIHCEEGDMPTDNLYRMVPPPDMDEIPAPRQYNDMPLNLPLGDML